MEGPDPKVMKQLLSELRDVNKEKRRTAVMKIGMLGGEQALRALMGAVSNEHEDLIVRGRSALMLGKMKDARAVDALISALSAPGFQTPIYAAEALGKIGDQRAVPHLIDLVERTQIRQDKTYDAAVQALRKLGYDPENTNPDPEPVLEM